MPDPTMRPIDDLIPADYNPRVDLEPGDEDYEQLKGSLTEFGLVEPLVWNRRTGNIVGGHQRLRVLRDEFGWTEVPVVEIDVDEQQERQLNVALNKIDGKWDDPRLADLLADLEAEAGEQILELAGFTERDVDDLLRRVESQRAAEVLERMAENPDDDPADAATDQELDPKERRKILGEQSIERNWFNIGYAVSEDDAVTIKEAVRVMRRRADLPTDGAAIVELCRWWLNHHAPDDAQS